MAEKAKGKIQTDLVNLLTKVDKATQAPETEKIIDQFGTFETSNLSQAKAEMSPTWNEVAAFPGVGHQ